MAGKWRAWRVALNKSFLLIFESPNSVGKWRCGMKMKFWRENGVLAGKWRFGGKMAYLAGNWRAWRVALNETILLIFESLKSAGKWRFGGKMNFWWENGVFGEKVAGLAGCP